MEDSKKNTEIKIEIDEQTANGIYSNIAIISHSESEFIMDFIFFHPQSPKAKVRTRIITSPAHAKKMMRALKDNITKFEAKFGEIKEATLQIPKEKTEYYN
ncbi:MAG: DUF3467 domain-containing protein [Endomicrobia bacterium]|nr:DUF3467 domain-containing protein [Endomicrobiia bacterium]MCL2507142.1 DUF3467 domain-containing protein [Endomicrobiia bacterium]